MQPTADVACPVIAHNGSTHVDFDVVVARSQGTALVLGFIACQLALLEQHGAGMGVLWNCKAGGRCLDRLEEDCAAFPSALSRRRLQRTIAFKTRSQCLEVRAERSSHSATALCEVVAEHAVRGIEGQPASLVSSSRGLSNMLQRYTTSIAVELSCAVGKAPARVKDNTAPCNDAAREGDIDGR